MAYGDFEANGRWGACLDTVASAFDGARLAVARGAVAGVDTLVVGGSAADDQGDESVRAMFEDPARVAVLPIVGLALPFTDGDAAECVVTAAIEALAEPYPSAVLSECGRVSRSPVRDGGHSLAVVLSSVAEEGTVPVFSEMTWFNEPSQSSIVDGSLHAETKSKTDFWRKTFYGFTRDDGHFLYEDVTGDFTAEVTISGSYETLYDQSGLMRLITIQGVVAA